MAEIFVNQMMEENAKQCQQCKEQEKRNQEANEELAKKDQIITMLKEEVDKKEKELTAMKGGKKKERTEMKKKERKEKEMTMKEELGKKEKELTAIKEEMKKKEKEMTAMNKEMEDKEKEITAMKEEMEKKDVEMTTVKKELQITQNVLEHAYFLELKDKCIINQKDKFIEKNNLLINELKDEIQRLSDLTFCGICYEEKIQVVFLPCRHFFCCHPCASVFRNCPMCKQGIRDTVAVFWGK